MRTPCLTWNFNLILWLPRKSVAYLCHLPFWHLKKLTLPCAVASLSKGACEEEVCAPIRSLFSITGRRPGQRGGEVSRATQPAAPGARRRSDSLRRCLFRKLPGLGDHRTESHELHGPNLQAPGRECAMSHLTRSHRGTLLPAPARGDLVAKQRDVTSINTRQPPA